MLGPSFQALKPSGLAESEKGKGSILFRRRKTLSRVKLEASSWSKENYWGGRQPEALWKHVSGYSINWGWARKNHWIFRIVEPHHGRDSGEPQMPLCLCLCVGLTVHTVSSQLGPSFLHFFLSCHFTVAPDIWWSGMVHWPFPHTKAG